MQFLLLVAGAFTSIFMLYDRKHTSSAHGSTSTATVSHRISRLPMVAHQPSCARQHRKTFKPVRVSLFIVSFVRSSAHALVSVFGSVRRCAHTACMREQRIKCRHNDRTHMHTCTPNAHLPHTPTSTPLRCRRSAAYTYTTAN